MGFTLKVKKKANVFVCPGLKTLNILKTSWSWMRFFGLLRPFFIETANITISFQQSPNCDSHFYNPRENLNFYLINRISMEILLPSASKKMTRIHRSLPNKILVNSPGSYQKREISSLCTVITNHIMMCSSSKTQIILKVSHTSTILRKTYFLVGAR